MNLESDNPKKKNDFRDRPQNEIPPSKRLRPNEIETQPPMMTFKAFLHSQDDNISDEEATSKYSEYKLEFRRQQLKEFFTAHKDEDWFQMKYHPVESVKRKEELKAAVHKRAAVFMRMLKSECFDGIPLESEHAEIIEKLLDSFVIKLEAGLDFMKTSCNSQKDGLIVGAGHNLRTTKSLLDDDKTETNSEIGKRDYEWIIIDDDGGDDDEDDVNSKLEKVNDALQFSEDNNGKEECNSKLQSNQLKEDHPSMSPAYRLPNKDNKENQSPNVLLHKSRSIFLRNISSRVAKSEIEEACQNYPGFLRVWLSETQPDQNWCRRGFVTFKRDVNIKEICWNLNSVKIKGTEWQAVVNHDLVKRIRSANVLANHKQVVMADMKLATKLIQELDFKAKLWNQDQQLGNVLGLETGNPLFYGIMDYLVEEAPAEAEELLGQSAVIDEYNAQTADKLKILDKLLFYLRMVHSLDYYNGSQYAQEDEMPNRCGIIHLRGPISPTEVSVQEVEDYIESHTEKLRPLLSPPPPLTQATLLSLGYKNKEVEIEKFMQTNSQELAQDKFLCPLSGKKFKAPEFVRKHILNKFPHELDMIRHDVDYYNNYIMDPKRPELPDHPGILIKKEFEQPYQFHYGGFRRGFPFGHFGGPGFFMRGRGIPGRGRGGEYRPVVTYRDLDAPSEPDEIV